MPYYVKLGEVPHKRHTQFRKPDGTLYREQVMGIKGFSGIQSILYHHHHPTEVRQVEDRGPVLNGWARSSPRERTPASAPTGSTTHLTQSATPARRSD